jgi:hypothetical protein
VAEFGDADLIAAEFARAHPARRAARRLPVTGPVVGSCWAVEKEGRPATARHGYGTGQPIRAARLASAWGRTW